MAGPGDDWEARRACVVECMCKVQVGFAVGGLRTAAFPVTWWGTGNRRERRERRGREGQGRTKEGEERRKKARAERRDRLGKREVDKEQAMEGSRGRTEDSRKLRSAPPQSPDLGVFCPAFLSGPHLPPSSPVTAPPSPAASTQVSTPTPHIRALGTPGEQDLGLLLPCEPQDCLGSPSIPGTPFSA